MCHIVFASVVVTGGIVSKYCLLYIYIYFFFLIVCILLILLCSSGDRDRAKCWYCNGGLQNWEANDEPFTEHAKWFPG